MPRRPYKDHDRHESKIAKYMPDRGPTGIGKATLLEARTGTNHHKSKLQAVNTNKQVLKRFTNNGAMDMKQRGGFLYRAGPKGTVYH
jgi:ABC-type transporter Mla maintaining outer membrane lipid asymmetry ATPase subunit MlaF